MISAVKGVEVAVEVICKPVCLRNSENLIIWVSAQSLNQVRSVLEPLASKIMSIRQLPQGMVHAAVEEIDFFLPDDGQALLHVVAIRTGTMVKVEQKEERAYAKVVG